MHHYSLSHLRSLLDTKQISAVELAQYFIERIEKLDHLTNAVITLNQTNALDQAQKADDLIQANKQRLLTGIPLLHKDIFCTQGIKTTCGSKMLHNFTAPYDATVVKQCRNAGSVMLGKTNMDEFAMGSSNETSYYGAVCNPWDLERVPGGSSGGSAAAVACGFAPVSTGTDTGGSIRQPAAFCGITGLKPTYGRVSRFGMIAYASSLDQGGPMARSAKDCALFLNEISGFDPNDSTSFQTNNEQDFTAQINESLQGLKIGIPREFFNHNHLDDKINSLTQKAIDQFKSAGAELIEIDLPNSMLAMSAYYIIAPAEASTNLARYDGVRFGYRCDEPQNLNDLYKRSRYEGFGDEVKRRIMVGTFALSSGYYDAYYAKSQKIRRLVSQEFAEVFNHKVDLILSPVTPEPAFKFGEKSDDPVSMYYSDIYTIPVNLAGLPALSMPIGHTEQSPVGVQLIGNHFQESKLLNAAHQYQVQTGQHDQLAPLG